MTTAPAIAAPPKGEAWHNRSAEEEAVKKEMEEKSSEFTEKGSELYAKA